MKSQLFILFLTFGSILSAQNFRDIPSPVPFEDVENGYVAFADVDGDNDQDLFINGRAESGQISKLYLNNGLGEFIELAGTPFEAVSNGSVTFADIDGDNDQDLLLSGFNGTTFICKLYSNDGNGNFTEVQGTPFPGFSSGSVAFVDVDGDNDQDLLISGEISSFTGSSKLYQNDGSGNFSEVMGTSFPDAYNSSIAFADIDGDNDQDLFISGATGTGNDNVAKMYVNDGAGNFTEVLGTSFIEVRNSAVAFSDIDGDNDKDLLITGFSTSGFSLFSNLYVNDGMGNFTELSGNSIIEVSGASLAFSDVDGDNDQDLFIFGSSYNDREVGRLYDNDGTGNFTEVLGTPFDSISKSSIAIADVDGNNTPDIIITGDNGDNEVSKLYTNDGQGDYTEVRDTPFEGVHVGSIAFADIDGDNDQDVIITGRNTSFDESSELYTNDGAGNFKRVKNTLFRKVFNSSVAFSDIDGDNDQDLIIAGSPFGIAYSDLYENDGAGIFSPIFSPFRKYDDPAVAILDVEGDNDEDVFIAGYEFNPFAESVFYVNDGSGSFSLNEDNDIESFEFCAMDVSDVDGDNDQDLLISGGGGLFARTIQMYLNDGLGNFTEVSGIPFEAVSNGSIAFADIDGDNDEDVLITGMSDSGRISKMYTNDGLGNFTELLNTPFEGVRASSVAFSDVDKDNDQDVLITGEPVSGIGISKLYINDGLGNFTELQNTPFQGVSFSSVAFVDVDGDTDEDVLITGYNDAESKPIAELYLNDAIISSTEDIIEKFELNFVAYPVPNRQGILNIRYSSELIGSLDVKIFDLSGKLFRNQQVYIGLGEQKFSIDTKDLKSGAYFIQLNNGENKGTQLFSVQ